MVVGFPGLTGLKHSPSLHFGFFRIGQLAGAPYLHVSDWLSMLSLLCDSHQCHYVMALMHMTVIVF